MQKKRSYSLRLLHVFLNKLKKYYQEQKPVFNTVDFCWLTQILDDLCWKRFIYHYQYFKENEILYIKIFLNTCAPIHPLEFHTRPRNKKFVQAKKLKNVPSRKKKYSILYLQTKWGIIYSEKAEAFNYKKNTKFIGIRI